MNRDEFNKWVNEFDKDYNTETKFCNTTVNIMNEYVYQPNYSKWRLQRIVENVFTEEELSNGVEKVMENTTTYLISQLTSISRMLRDDQFFFPIGITIFPTGETFVHPGQTRMLMGDVHTSPVDFILTFYPNASEKVKQLEAVSRIVKHPEDDDISKIKPFGNLPLYSADEYHMKIYKGLRNVKHYAECACMGDDFWQTVKNNSDRDNFVYKDHLGDINFGYKYTMQNTEEHLYSVRNNMIYVDDVPILKKTDEYYPWRFA